MRLATTLVLALLVTVSLATFGCKTDTGVSASDCMQGFADSLNSGSFDLGGYTHSNVDAAYHYLALTTLFWESKFQGDGSFTFTMNGNSATATEAGVNFVFTLTEDDKDKYAISTITRNGVDIFH
jgi:hypothetical protein